MIVDHLLLINCYPRSRAKHGNEDNVKFAGENMKQIETIIETRDCLKILKQYPDNFFNLFVTSPPYADSRSKTYGGIKPNEYVEWFLPRAKEFLRVLRSDGTFSSNIKEKAVNGERHT